MGLMNASQPGPPPKLAPSANAIDASKAKRRVDPASRSMPSLTQGRSGPMGAG